MMADAGASKINEALHKGARRSPPVTEREDADFKTSLLLSRLFTCQHDR